ncbi:MAG: Holliday junction resolvase RuvX [Candidatus Gottesmanbacteria bacterium]
MKYLGIDYGNAKIGLAMSEGKLAEPIGSIKTLNSKSQITNICERDVIEKIVIGISEGKMAMQIKKFGDELETVINIPIEYWDETLSSIQAREKMIEAGKPQMKKKTDEHSIAAALILQDYLDNKKDSL